MSTSSPAQKQEYIVILPDKPHSLQKRLEVRPDHLKAMKPKVESGLFTFGGSYFDEHPSSGETPDMKGSVMLAQAGSREEVMELLQNDIYSTSGVWDLSKVQIHAFRSALRRGMDGGI